MKTMILSSLAATAIALSLGTTTAQAHAQPRARQPIPSERVARRLSVAEAEALAPRPATGPDTSTSPPDHMTDDTSESGVRTHAVGTYKCGAIALDARQHRRGYCERY